MGHHCRGGPAPGTGLLVAVLCRSPQVEPRVAPARADYSAIPRSRSYLPLKQRQHRLALTQLLQLSARCHTVFRNAYAVVFIVVNVSQVQMFIHGTLNKKMLSIALQTRSRLKRADCARRWGNASLHRIRTTCCPPRSEPNSKQTRNYFQRWKTTEHSVTCLSLRLLHMWRLIRCPGKRHAHAKTVPQRRLGLIPCKIRGCCAEIYHVACAPGCQGGRAARVLQPATAQLGLEYWHHLLDHSRRAAAGAIADCRNAHVSAVQQLRSWTNDTVCRYGTLPARMRSSTPACNFVRESHRCKP